MSNKQRKIIAVIAVCVAVAALAGAVALYPRESQTTPPAQVQTSRPAQTEPEITTQPTLPQLSEPETTAPQETTQPPEETTEPDEPEPTVPSATQPREPEETQAPVEGLAFPQVLENGGLRVESLFQFTGFNPDCRNESGEDIAGIMVTNTSGRHLQAADLTLYLADGSELRFSIADLPDGKRVMAYSLDNTSIPDGSACVDIRCVADFVGQTPLVEDLDVRVSGMEITLTNFTGRDLTNIRVYCHCVLGEDYFGGVTYCYTVDLLRDGQSTTVLAQDCILGQADVVRIDCSG